MSSGRGRLSEPGPSRGVRVGTALAIVYLLWGSTYLAIRFAVDSVPPFAMGGFRFSVAGWMLYLLLRARGEPSPDRSQWRSIGLVGILLLGLGNGAVAWAEQRIPSGATALIVAGVPAWTMLLDWLRPKGNRPSGRVLIGVALGLVGIGLLVLAAGRLPVERIDPAGALVLMGGSIIWSIGTIAGRALVRTPSALLTAAMQMIAAGLFLALLSLSLGEWREVDLTLITPASIAAIGYLIVFGSWIGFGAYTYLLRTTTPTVVSTHAYVNPAVAVLLGWWLAEEVVNRWTLGAMVVILTGVVLVTFPAPDRSRSD